MYQTLLFQVQLSPGLCPDFSEVPENVSPSIDEYANIRISQVYGLLNTAMISATSSSDGKTILLCFQICTASNVGSQVFLLIYLFTLYRFDIATLFKYGQRCSSSSKVC